MVVSGANRTVRNPDFNRLCCWIRETATCFYKELRFLSLKCYSKFTTNLKRGAMSQKPFAKKFNSTTCMDIVPYGRADLSCTMLSFWKRM